MSLALFAGCDLFSTREILSRPSDIHSFATLLKVGDSAVFSAVETLRDSAGKAGLTLSRRRIAFTLLSDSTVGADTLKLVAIRITEDPSGAVLETGTRQLLFAFDGVWLNGVIGGGGARYFPLKAAAGDSLTQLALPAVFSEGWATRQSMGALKVNRALQGVDTLGFHGHSEATWTIVETVMDADTALAVGTYWYGVSGLLRCDQDWSGFAWRAADGSTPGKASLHRQVTRL